MSANNATINSLKGTSTLVRARFGPGMLLQHEDLEQLSTYTRELSRLMFRSLFGCGVVCGLVVTTEEKCGGKVTISSGLALDCTGDPIYLPDKQTLAIAKECEEDLVTPVWVILCRTTKCCSPRTTVCASDDDESSSTCTRERDGFEIRVVRELPRCICRCERAAVETGEASRVPEENDCACVDPEHPCYVDHYQGKCCSSYGEDCDCCCECVVLAQLDKVGDTPWTVDHSVRRFVRPVLMRDPEVVRDRERRPQKDVDPASPPPAPEPPPPAPPPVTPASTPATPAAPPSIPDTTAVLAPARNDITEKPPRSQRRTPRR